MKAHTDSLKELLVVMVRVLATLSALLMAFALTGGFVLSAPLLWSYPNDHLLVSEVEYHGSGSEPATEWLELYNPTSGSITLDGWYVEDGEGTWTIPDSTPDNTVASNCFAYIARNGDDFYDEYNQCPDFAVSSTHMTCTNTVLVTVNGTLTMNNDDDSLCLYNSGSTLIDAVGWGAQSGGCLFVSPLDVNESSGETILRGDDNPAIGPGGEGTETSGQPLTELITEVWRLADDVAVDWEGVETTQCRTPTRLTLHKVGAHPGVIRFDLVVTMVLLTIAALGALVVLRRRA